jgi:hypothetical protein
MEATIEVNGWLKIKRKRGWANQFCLHDKESRCGDHCPAFVETQREGVARVLLFCCAGTPAHEITQDLREKGKV